MGFWGRYIFYLSQMSRIINYVAADGFLNEGELEEVGFCGRKSWILKLVRRGLESLLCCLSTVQTWADWLPCENPWWSCGNLIKDRMHKMLTVGRCLHSSIVEAILFKEPFFFLLIFKWNFSEIISAFQPRPFSVGGPLVVADSWEQAPSPRGTQISRNLSAEGSGL